MLALVPGRLAATIARILAWAVALFVVQVAQIAFDAGVSAMLFLPATCARLPDADAGAARDQARIEGQIRLDDLLAETVEYAAAS
jgi:hypothetical protein